MSLYHEAAEVLTKVKSDKGSLKSVVFGNKSWKSDSRTLFALTAEAAKWSSVLVEVVENSGILNYEKLSPALALLLTHDLLLVKKGIALPPTHGLYVAVSRHKARLTAELTKARIRRGYASLEALREKTVLGEENNSNLIAPNTASLERHPRWIRINTLKTSLEHELTTTFSEYEQVGTLKEIIHAAPERRLVHTDEHVPNLIAVAGSEDATKWKAYKDGNLILQEKASCFPAYLLDPVAAAGDVIDACAAPGNKTTHLTAILGNKRHVTACEKDPVRSKTLDKMVKLAGASNSVTVKQKQDFLKLDPSSEEFANVTSLLLDPSCSGSGIVGRDEGTVVVHLPNATAQEAPLPSRKRKRVDVQDSTSKSGLQAETELDEETPEQEDDAAKLKIRLASLSSFQLRLLRRAMSFPKASRITYSTCSVHAEENEHVVVKALLCEDAESHGWRIMKRGEQVDGMQRWHKRGHVQSVEAMIEQITNRSSLDLDPYTVSEACIRCDKRGADGTMGFFVAGFVRDSLHGHNTTDSKLSLSAYQHRVDDEDEWEGFSDEDS